VSVPAKEQGSSSWSSPGPFFVGIALLGVAAAHDDPLPVIARCGGHLPALGNTQLNGQDAYEHPADSLVCFHT
jgi:hypothetical protein